MLANKKKLKCKQLPPLFILQPCFYGSTNVQPMYGELRGDDKVDGVYDGLGGANQIKIIHKQENTLMLDLLELKTTAPVLYIEAHVSTTDYS